jgi:capsule polysaccharide export protein KpsE/RkpR
MPMGRTTNEVLMETQQDQDIAEKFVEIQRWSAVAEHLWSRRVGVLLWTLAGAVLSAIVAWRVCKFEATVQLMPPDSPGGGLAALALPSLMKAPGLAGLSGMAGDLLGIKSTGALFVKVLQSRRVEDNLINAKDLRKVYGVRYMEDARSKLEWRTTISEDKKSGVISVSVRDRDAKLATELADLYRQQLGMVMMEVSTSAARREREFIEGRLQEEKKQLDEAEQRFSKFASSSMALDIPQQTRVMVEAAARLQGELIAARAEMEGLEQIYTSENVRVKTLKARVNELQREMDKINKGGPVKGQPGDSSAEYPSVKNLPLVGIEWTDLFRNTKIHETVFELLTQQYEVARIQEARDFPTVKVLDEAVVPEKRHPRPLAVISLGALAGALLACLGIFLQYRWQGWGADDPRRVLVTSLFRRRTEFTGDLGADRRG